MLYSARKLSALIFGLLVLLVASCQSSNNGTELEKGSQLVISSQISPLRAYDSTWESGDQLGVFAITSGNVLTATSIYNSASNVQFTTDGSGQFRARSQAIRLEQNKNVDVIAYYPFSDNVGADFTLPLDVSEQSNPAAIDLLYAKSTTPVSLANPNASLIFDHKLSQLVVTLITQDGSTLTDTQSTLDGTIVKGTFDIATGEVRLGSFKSAISGKKRSENGGSASLSYLLLPGQTLENAIVTFTVNNRRYTHKITAAEAVMMEGGYRYTFPFAIASSGELHLLVDGAIIDPIEDGGEGSVDGKEDAVVVTENIAMPANESNGKSLFVSVDVAAAADEVWTATADQGFVKLSQSSTEGHGQLTITLDENPTFEERLAKVTVTIVPKSATASIRASGLKRIFVYNITQAAKQRPAGEANLLVLDAPFSSGMDGFVGASINGTQEWHHSSNKGVYYAKMSGYDSTAKRAYANIDWLISPQFDLTETTIAKLTFKHAINFATNINEEATLYFSTNYNGNVENARWIKVEIPTYPSGSDWTFVESGEIPFPSEVLGQPDVRFAFKYTSTDANASTWEINALQVKADAGRVVGGVAPKPDPDPNPNPVVGKAHYMEIPIVPNGRMTDGYYVMHTAPDNYFAGGTTPGGIRRNYTIFFSKNSSLPYWVAYPLYPDCMGSVSRTNAWDWDPKIPREYQPLLKQSYTNNQSRGHLLASYSRRATSNLDRTTFYYTNMIPQVGNHNSGNWNAFETLEQGWGRKNDKDTIYVVTGPIFDPNTSNTCSDNSGRKIPIPTHSWKVMLRYDRAAKKYYSIAVRIPNTATKSKWNEHVTTVAALEKELGITFFTHLPAEVAAEVKSQKEIKNWE